MRETVCAAGHDNKSIKEREREPEGWIDVITNYKLLKLYTHTAEKTMVTKGYAWLMKSKLEPDVHLTPVFIYRRNAQSTLYYNESNKFESEIKM